MLPTDKTPARRSRLAAVAAVGVILTGGIALTGVTAHGASHEGNPSTLPKATPNFNNPQANAYFPITPGLVTRLRGTDGGAHFREVVTVTDKTKVINGIEATTIRDILRRSDGTLAEKTRDWYADDDNGNVWYLGEHTATYDRHGHVRSREGSWQAGVNGARMGKIMTAHPVVTDAYRQEYLKGHAEDQAWIVQRGATVTVPAGTYSHVVRSLEWSRLEPRNVSVKFYAPGIGILTEHDMSGGSERFWLVSVTKP
jgi:hypothetical protein